MDSATKQALGEMKVESFREVAELDTATILERLDDAPFPGSERLSAAVLLTAIEKLRKENEKAREENGRLLFAAWLTLAVALVSLIVAVLGVAHVF